MKLRYTFDEFCSHFRAMETVRHYTEVRGSYDVDKEPIHVGDQENEFANTMRVMDYFAQIEGKPDTSKMAAFMGIMSWLATNAATFVSSGVARGAGEDGLFEFHHSLLRAAFDAFEANKWEHPKIEPVIARAKQLMGEQEAGA